MADASRPLQDRIHYPGGAWEHSHPDRIAANARMHGLNPAPVDRCRVLELGCGAGGNLVPMACGLPDARFVGVAGLNHFFSSMRRSKYCFGISFSSAGMRS